MRAACCYLTLLCCLCIEVAVGEPRLLVVFLDGFRWDYLTARNADHESLRNFQRLKYEGASVERMKPVFPADCFPNIYSMFTGRYPYDHGVLFNDMYNSVNGDAFQHEDQTTRDRASKWVLAETIWQKLSRQGRKSLLHQLPTCHPAYRDETDGFNGDHCQPYNKANMTIDQLILQADHVLDQLLQFQYHLAVLYHDSIDESAHFHGPWSEEILKRVLPRLDTIFGRLLDRVDAHNQSPEGQREPIHLVFLSDHGLSATSGKQFIKIDENLMNRNLDKITNRGTSLSLWVKPKRIEETWKMLHLQKTHFQVYSRDTLPDGWRLSDKGNLREYFPTFYLVAQPGYVFISTIATSNGTDNSQLGYTKERKGWHGYSPEHPDMHTPLMVYGPRARTGVRLLSQTGVESVHVYDLLADLLELNQTQLSSYQLSYLLHPKVRLASAWMSSRMLFLLVLILVPVNLTMLLFWLLVTKVLMPRRGRRVKQEKNEKTLPPANWQFYCNQAMLLPNADME